VSFAATSKGRSGLVLPAAANFLMPVLGVLAPGPENGIGLPRCWPELKEVVIHHALGELPHLSFIPSVGADTQPVGTRRKSYGPGMAPPVTPGYLVAFRQSDGYLDDVLPPPSVTFRWGV